MDNMNMQQDMNNNINNNIYNQQNMNYIQQVEDERTANTLAGTSLACILGSKLISIASLIFSAAVTGQNDIIDFMISLVSGLAGILSLSGLVTMIVTRVKYPNNKLGKAAMWTYIALVIIEVLIFAICAIACVVAGVALLESCRNCPG